MSGLQKNVASQKVRVFAFDKTTNTPKTGDAANITAKISKDWGVATAITDTNPIEVEDGYYLFDLTQSETNANVLDIYPESSTADIVVVGVPGTIFTVPPNFTATSIAATGEVSSDVAKISGDTTAADNAELAFDGTGYGFTGCTVPTVTTLTGHTPQTGDSFARIGANGAGLTAVPWNTAWDAEVQSECADALAAYDPPTKTELDSAFTEIKGATWSATTDTLEHIRDKQTDIEADTNELQTDWADGGRLDLLLDDAASAGDPWATSVPGTYGAGTAGYILGTNLDATVSTRMPTTHINATAGKVDGVALVDTTTSNTDMRGTDNAALASVCTEVRLAELDAANLPTDVTNVKSDTAAILDDTGTNGVLLAPTATSAQLVDAVRTELDANSTQLSSLQNKADRNADLIESHRGTHTWRGNWWYVDPVNGNDTTGDGSRAAPYATVTKAHTEATDNNHDVIFLLARSGAGVTTLTEQVTISKNYLLIRGPGRDFLWNYNANGDVITVTGNGVELSGFRAQTHTLGSGNAITISGDFCRVHKTWLEYARSYGVYIDNASWCQIHENIIKDCGKDTESTGIYVGQSTGTSEHNRIQNNEIYDTTGAAIEIQDAVADTIIHENNLHGSSTYGLLINAGVLRTGVYLNRYSNNTLDHYLDSGTDTTFMNNEQWAKDSIATETRLAELDAANLPTDVANISSTLGTAGDGLTLVPWNLAWDAEVESEVTDALVAYDPPTNAEMEARTPTSAELAYITRHAQLAKPVTFSGGTTTTAVIATIDGNTPSSVDDFYNGRVLLFNAGTLDEQVTRISDYDGTTKTATIDTITTAVTSSHEAVLI